MEDSSNERSFKLYCFQICLLNRNDQIRSNFAIIILLTTKFEESILWLSADINQFEHQFKFEGGRA